MATGELELTRRVGIGLCASFDSQVEVVQSPGRVHASSRFFAVHARLTLFSFASTSLEASLDLGAEWVSAASEGYSREGSVNLLAFGLEPGLAMRQRLVGPVELVLFAGVRLRRAERFDVEGMGSVMTLSVARPVAALGLGVRP